MGGVLVLMEIRFLDLNFMFLLLGCVLMDSSSLSWKDIGYDTEEPVKL